MGGHAKRYRGPAAVFALLMLAGAAASSAVASPMTDGAAAYKAHDYPNAIVDFKQAATQLSGVEQAKAYYKLGLAYRKEDQNALALQAFQQAQTVDPTLSFASSPSKFRAFAADVEPGAGRGSNQAATGDPAAAALTASNVYVDSSLQQSVDSTALEEASESDNGNTAADGTSFLQGCPFAGLLGSAHTIVKVAVLQRIPSGYSSAAEYAAELHKYLDLGNNAVIVVGYRPSASASAGVGLATGNLSSSEANSLAQKYVGRIGSGNMTAGLSSLTLATINAVDTKERIGPESMSIVILLIIVIVMVYLIYGARKKAAELQSMRVPLNTLRDNVLQNIQYIDNYADVLPRNNADTDQVRAYRQAAEAKFEQADKIMVKATDASELYRAQSILDKANADLSKAREYLDRATGGASKIPGDDAVRPPELPSSSVEAQQIPAHQRGVSFFSSRPAPVASLVPVTLNIDGQTRSVMATPEEAEEIRMGRVPPVRAFNDNGRMVPWYNYSNYDPYRDYYQYENNGWNGFGSGAIAGFIGAELLDSLFTPHYYGNWYSPYGYSPGFGNFGGWNDYGYNGGYGQGLFDAQQANNFAFEDRYNQPPMDNAGGASFMGSGYDQSDYNNSGGTSFGDRS